MVHMIGENLASHHILDFTGGWEITLPCNVSNVFSDKHDYKNAARRGYTGQKYDEDRFQTWINISALRKGGLQGSIVPSPLPLEVPLYVVRSPRNHFGHFVTRTHR